jgi:hypothetical protein
MLVPQGESKEFLGSDFLTWLWYHGEKRNWTLELPNKTSVSYGMDDLLVLEPDKYEGCSQRLSGDVPTRTPEAQAGLQEGKKVKATRLVIVLGEREWTTTIRNDFSFSSLILNDPETPDQEERFMELAGDLEQIAGLFDQIYHYFLGIRTSEEWTKTELPLINKWVQECRENH